MRVGSSSLVVISPFLVLYWTRVCPGSQVAIPASSPGNYSARVRCGHRRAALESLTDTAYSQLSFNVTKWYSLCKQLEEFTTQRSRPFFPILSDSITLCIMSKAISTNSSVMATPAVAVPCGPAQAWAKPHTQQQFSITRHYKLKATNTCHYFTHYYSHIFSFSQIIIYGRLRR